MRKKKQRNCFEDNLDAQIVKSWVIGRIAQNATSMGQRKGNIIVNKIVTQSMQEKKRKSNVIFLLTMQEKKVQEKAMVSY
jgi:hypothetical protein